MILDTFKSNNLLEATKSLFRELNIPVNYVTDEPTTAREILEENYKENYSFRMINDVYFVGMIDDDAFQGNSSIEPDKITEKYEGILIFALTLKPRENGLLPTRSQLAEITRAFNREFKYTPVVLVFKYKDNENEYIAFANAERLPYEQKWREGEKAGKVKLLRDINIQKPHRGHEDIINQLKIPTSGTNKIDTFEKLYNYWQEVFSVSILNKKFYNELQNWYFWAIHEVIFPNQPNRKDYEDETKYKEALKKHKAENIIRLLTRILFIWFIKEKGLIPEEIFNEKIIPEKFLKKFSPEKPFGFFDNTNKIDGYYRAILQNLFFATLNKERGKREFRKENQHYNVTNLMRYKSYLKNPDYLLRIMEENVPFMNGGLFECLDKPKPGEKGPHGGDVINYIDGFSDRDDNPLFVPDYLFFEKDLEVDISKDLGDKKFKKAKTRGLIEIWLYVE